MILFAGLLPIVLIAALIHHYGVNVPYGDDWALVTLFEKWSSEGATFAPLWAQHGEHRIVIPKLIYLAFAYWTHWNLRAEMLFSLLLCVATSAGFYLILKRTVNAPRSTRLGIWVFLNVFLFSPIQAENWVWGFQLQIFLVNLCLVGAILCLTPDCRSFVGLAAAAGLTVVATFSFGGGMLLWPVLLLHLFLSGARKKLVLAWLGCAAAIIGLYFVGYHLQPSPIPLEGRLDYVTYFVAFLGTAFVGLPPTKELTLSVMAGVIAVSAYVAASVYAPRCPERRRRCAPWLAIGAYALLSAVTAARSRIGAGATQAMDSRYTTIAMNLLFALLGVVAVVISLKKKGIANDVRAWESAAVAGIASLLTLYLASFPLHLLWLQKLNRERQQGKTALAFINLADPAPEKVRLKLVTHLNDSTELHYSEVLNRLGFLRPKLRANGLLADGEDRPLRSTGEYGQFESGRVTDRGTFLVQGWAYLGPEDRQVSGVVLAYAEEKKWLAFALADPFKPRADLVGNKKSEAYLHRGWSREFERARLPSGATEISAWAVDADGGLTYRLPGSCVVQ